MSSIGKRLKHKRLELGLIQTDVAEVAGVTAASISKWESNGGAAIAAICALKIAEYLNVNPFWLVMGQGTPSDKRMFPEISSETDNLIRQLNRLPKSKRDLIHQVVSAMDC